MTATLTHSRASSPRFDSASEQHTSLSLGRYLGVGIVFGLVLLKSEVIFWGRIQEMFRFESFHMYGVLGSALVTAFLSVRVLKWFGTRARNGEVIALAPKSMERGHRYWIGGGIFGIGWALCGACPGPMFALMGSGATVFAATGVATLAGTWTYGVLRPRLPH